jgi:hypothetical protein
LWLEGRDREEGSDVDDHGRATRGAHGGNPRSGRLRDHGLASADRRTIVRAADPPALLRRHLPAQPTPNRPVPRRPWRPPCDKAPKRFDPKQIDLTGAWSGDDDGIYYLRQVGSVVWWNGMSGRADNPWNLGRDWNNVGRGEIKELNIAVEWADVPRGEILGNGTLSLKIADDGTGNVTIVKVSETGTGFGNNVWTPCTPG